MIALSYLFTFAAGFCSLLLIGAASNQNVKHIGQFLIFTITCLLCAIVAYSFGATP